MLAVIQLTSLCVRALFEATPAGEMQSQVNFAEAQKQKIILESEAARIDAANRAHGEKRSHSVVYQVM